MQYAKLINNEIQFAQRSIVVDDRQIGNPPAEMLIEMGYKPVRYTDPPIVEPGYIAVPGWTETADEIVQSWELVEIPITDEESLTRYSNELTGATDETLVEAAETLIKIVKRES